MNNNLQYIPDMVDDLAGGILRNLPQSAQDTVKFLSILHFASDHSPVITFWSTVDGKIHEALSILMNLSTATCKDGVVYYPVTVIKQDVSETKYLMESELYTTSQFRRMLGVLYDRTRRVCGFPCTHRGWKQLRRITRYPNQRQTYVTTISQGELRRLQASLRRRGFSERAGIGCETPGTFVTVNDQFLTINWRKRDAV